MRILSSLFLAITLSLMMSGCGAGGSIGVSGGGGPNTGSQALNAGNWILVATSSTFVGRSSGISGALASSGDAVSGQMSFYPLSVCGSSAPRIFSGKVSGNNINLQSASVAGVVITISGTLQSSTNINGTYNCSNGADAGTIYGTFVPAVTGDWSGTLNVMAQDPIDLNYKVVATLSTSLSLIQGANSNSNGSFPISGTASFQFTPVDEPAVIVDPSCYPTAGTIDINKSFLLGDVVNLVVNADSAPTTTISVSSARVLNPGSATQVSVLSANTSSCTFYYFTGTLKKS